MATTGCADGLVDTTLELLAADAAGEPGDPACLQRRRGWPVLGHRPDLAAGGVLPAVAASTTAPWPPTASTTA
ncbi:MAG: hypothetical protein R3F43_03475 [bacterium]